MSAGEGFVLPQRRPDSRGAGFDLGMPFSLTHCAKQVALRAGWKAKVDVGSEQCPSGS